MPTLFPIQLRTQIEGDDFGGAFTHAFGHVIARYDQVFPSIVLAAQNDVSVRVAGIEMIDCDPIELRTEVFLHLLHQPPCHRPKIVVLRAVLRRDNDPELVAVIATATEEVPALRAIIAGVIELSGLTVSSHAIALDISQMLCRRFNARAFQFDHARFDDHPACTEGGIAVALGQHAADTGATANAVALEFPSRAALAGQRRSLQHTLEIAPTGLAAAVSDFAELRFEFVVEVHALAAVV